MWVSHWMARPVVTVKPQDTLRTARRLMAEHRINQLPVVKNDKLIGIVTDRDLRDAYPSSTQIYRSKKVDEFADSYTVKEVMTFNVISVTSDTSLEEAVALLRRHRIGALPVIEKGKLVGIFTRSDVLDFLLSERNKLPYDSGGRVRR
jgi:acetoin utilization protein AcuB